MVPETGLEVIKRRCCCGGTEPGGIDCPECPEPVSPCATPRYRLTVTAGNIIADSAGKGCLAISSHVLDCMRGSCGRTPYRRKALTLSTAALAVCDTSTMCQDIGDEAGPYTDGKHRIDWEACDCNSFEPDVADACVTDWEQVENVYITWLAAQVYWNPAAGPPDPCSRTLQTYTVTRTWVCQYSRRVQAGEFMAVGTYRLVRCVYPSAINTIGPTGGWNPGCGIAGGTVCSADGLTSVGNIPTLWQPPNSINVERLC